MNMFLRKTNWTAVQIQQSCQPPKVGWLSINDQGMIEVWATQKLWGSLCLLPGNYKLSRLPSSGDALKLSNSPSKALITLADNTSDFERCHANIRLR